MRTRDRALPWPLLLACLVACSPAPESCVSGTDSPAAPSESTAPKDVDASRASDVQGGPSAGMKEPASKGASLRASLDTGDRAIDLAPEVKTRIEGLVAPADAAAILDLATGKLLLEVHGSDLKIPSHPGSVFKLVTAAAMIQGGLEDQGFVCRGEAEIDGRPYRCWTRDGHGQMHLAKAIALSCNLYFYDLAGRIDPALFLDVLRRFGFERASGLAPGEQVGFFPEGFSRGELRRAALGESDRIMPTGLQLLKFVSILSGRGPASAAGRPGDEIIRQAMADAVAFGTAGPGQIGLPYAAKTGTARLSGSWRYHGWCVGFAPATQPRVAFVVHKGVGMGSEAARIAQDIVAVLMGGSGL